MGVLHHDDARLVLDAARRGDQTDAPHRLQSAGDRLARRQLPHLGGGVLGLGLSGLDELGGFLEANGPGIFATRPWEHGERVRGADDWSWWTTRAAPSAPGGPGTVYLFGMGPADEAEADSLEERTFAAPGTSATWVEVPAPVAHARLLGSAEPVEVEAQGEGSRLRVPATGLAYAVGIEARLADGPSAPAARD